MSISLLPMVSGGWLTNSAEGSSTLPLNSSIHGERTMRISYYIHVFIAVTCLTPVCTLAGSGTIHVSTNGSDIGGDGSAGNPVASLQKAFDLSTDGDTILVSPGLYKGGVAIEGAFDSGVTIKSETPYHAKLTHTAPIFVISNASGITIEGFEILHDGYDVEPDLIQVDGKGLGATNSITVRNNIIHDSFSGDLIQINNRASDVEILGNMFYNQADESNHIELNSVERITMSDNIFFNDFSASVRTNTNSTSSFIAASDSNSDEDGLVGCDNIQVLKNVFMSWEGNPDAFFVQLGGEGHDYYESNNSVIQNNLIIGNSANVIGSAFGFKRVNEVKVNFNTFVGNLPSHGFAVDGELEDYPPTNKGFRFSGNIFSDPTGTMGARNNGDPLLFANTPLAHLSSFSMEYGLYFNGDLQPPVGDIFTLLGPVHDGFRITEDPLLADNRYATPPSWNPSTQSFIDGSTTIRQAFVRVVNLYGTPARNSPVIDADSSELVTITEDILGNPRDSKPDIGAVEIQPVRQNGFMMR